MIDINKIDDDIMEEKVNKENEETVDMLNRLSKEILWKSTQEIYLEWILLEIMEYRNTPEEDRNPQMKDKYLKCLDMLDKICWYTKDKKDVVIKTALKSSSDIFNSTNIE